ncbi:MBL fold metallo-hydrolase [Paenibacillus tyrfis]|uniref:MBL fold metallo-hydrolase n=1 Tax=Paenibacillus tyrfis TaxID=1501230 RepID=UPI000B588CE3|nr:MBL fold metallo-hydrolase [Paenibacillus tyrfis]
MQLDIWGGAGEHGRSCYLLHNDRIGVLLDCGVKKTGAGQYPLVDPNVIPRLNAVFLSHAHEDHSMALPLLYKHGYRGVVWTTRATAQQLDTYFASWKKYVRGQSAELPYSDEHVEAIRFAYLEEAGATGEWIDAAPHVKVCWGRSGHLVGSVWLMLELEGKRVFFSGDYSSESVLLAADGPEALPPGTAGRTADLAVIDAAYGMDAEVQPVLLERLAARIGQALAQGGSVLLPVPAFGRGQDMLVWARERFPGVPLVAERELLQAFGPMLDRPEWLKPGAAERIRRCLEDPRVIAVATDAQREQALAAGRSALYFTADGMMQSERAQWYYRRLAAAGNGCVILTGHLAAGSFGQRLLDGPEAGGGCSVEAIRYKVHQGLTDVRRMLRAFGSRQSVPVHTGRSATDALCAALAAEGFAGLHSLGPGEALRF